MGILNDDRKPYWPLLPIIVLLAVLMVWMNSYMPPADLAPLGYSSVILAFEFILSESDLKAVLDPLNSQQIDDLDMVNRIDFGYMIVYSALLAGFYYISRKLSGMQYLTIGLGLAGCALFADLFENIQLLDLSRMYRNNITGSSESVIGNLFLFTWLKWGALALAMALLFPVLEKRGGFSKAIAFFLLLPILNLFAVAIWQTPKMIDQFSTAIILGFIALIIYVIAYRVPPPSTEKN